jgi:hypothetical protein
MADLKHKEERNKRGDCSEFVLSSFLKERKDMFGTTYWIT